MIERENRKSRRDSQFVLDNNCRSEIMHLLDTIENDAGGVVQFG